MQMLYPFDLSKRFSGLSPHASTFKLGAKDAPWNYLSFDVFRKLGRWVKQGNEGVCSQNLLVNLHTEGTFLSPQGISCLVFHAFGLRRGAKDAP